MCFFFSALLGAGYNILVRPWLLRDDIDMADEYESQLFPGDNLIEVPDLQITRAITIAASTEEIWPWLAQMGRQRCGYYGMDRLDNWNIPSVRYLRQDIEPLAVGMTLDDGLRVLNFVENEYLLLGSFRMPNDMGGRSDFVYLYQLVPLAEYQTQLLIRTHIQSDGLQGWLFNRMYEVMDYWMVRARLEGIKLRAEGHAPDVVDMDLLTPPQPIEQGEQN